MKTRSKILVVIVVLAVVGIFMLMPNGSYRRAAEAYKRELRAKGEKITVAELMPARTTTNMSRGAQLFMALTNLSDWPTNLPNRMAMVDSKHARIGFTNITAEQLKAYDANAKRMAGLREALDAGPFDFNLDYSLGPELLLPHLARFKSAQQTAAATAMMAMKKEDFAEAWLDVLAMVDIVERLKNEPIMVSGLVQVADANIAIPATWEALEGHEWTGDQLRELQTRWSGFNLFTNAETSLSIEVATSIVTFELARSSYEKVLGTFLPGPSANGPPPMDDDTTLKFSLARWKDKYPRYWAWRSTFSYDEEIYCIETVQAAKESVRRIIKLDSAQPALDELPAELARIAAGHPRTTSHFKIFTPGFGAAFSKYMSRMAAGEAYRRLLVTAIALKRYQLAHGAYPARLDELVRDYLPKLPVDLMHGKPLRYRLESNGEYLLYSVLDDAGTTDRVWPRPVDVPRK